MIRKITGFMLLVLLVWMVFFIMNIFKMNNIDNNELRNNIQDIYNSSVSGVVTNRYVDVKDHSRRFLILNVFNNSSILNYESDERFNCLMRNDSIFKKSDSFIIEYKRNGVKKSFNLEFDRLKKKKRIMSFIDSLNTKSPSLSAP